MWPVGAPLILVELDALSPAIMRIRLACLFTLTGTMEELMTRGVNGLWRMLGLWAFPNIEGVLLVGQHGSHRRQLWLLAHHLSRSKVTVPFRPGSELWEPTRGGEIIQTMVRAPHLRNIRSNHIPSGVGRASLMLHWA